MISLTGKTARLITQLEGCLTEYVHTHTRTRRSRDWFPLSLTLSHNRVYFLRMKGYTPVCPDYTVFSNLALQIDPLCPINLFCISSQGSQRKKKKNEYPA